MFLNNACISAAPESLAVATAKMAAVNPFPPTNITIPGHQDCASDDENFIDDIGRPCSWYDKPEKCIAAANGGDLRSSTNIKYTQGTSCGYGEIRIGVRGERRPVVGVRGRGRSL